MSSCFRSLNFIQTGKTKTIVERCVLLFNWYRSENAYDEVKRTRVSEHAYGSLEKETGT